MINNMKKILVSLALLTLLPINAGASNLYCTITSVNRTSADGSGLEKISNGVRGLYVDADGSEFIINRSSGLMVGRFVSNDPWAWDSRVIEYGDSENSFKMYVHNRLGAKRAQYIDVKTWADGDRKPFVLVYDYVFLGYCTYAPFRK
jgi:hypothetical protein